MIENKIDAGEQINQLKRYYKKFPNGRLLYLTMTGYLSSYHDDLKKENILYESISYENEITNWLKSCIDAVAHKNYLKNAITQYLRLIENLNNKTMANKKNDEICELINLNPLAAYEIKSNLIKATENRFQTIAEKIVKELGVE